MNKILIPIDFSAASANVLDYVAALSHDVAIDQIIVLKSFSPSIFEQILPSTDTIQIDMESVEAEKAAIKKRVEDMVKGCLDKVKKGVRVDIGISEKTVLRSINELIAQEKPTLLAVTSDQSDPDEGYIGTHVIPIVKTSAIPVLVIPSKVKYNAFRKALIPVDFKALFRLNVLKELLTFKNEIKPELMILNVDPEQKSPDPDPETKTGLDEVLHDHYSYSLHVAANKNVLNGIFDFTNRNELQLIVALPGKYSFFTSLTHKSITEALTLSAQVPVLVLK